VSVIPQDFTHSQVCPALYISYLEKLFSAGCFRQYRSTRLQPIMAHAEVQGKAAYNNKAESGAAAAASRFQRPSEAPAASSVIFDYEESVYQGGDFTSL